MGRLAAEDADYVVQAAGLVAKGQRAKTADELIANRAELLRAYQNEDYAQQYRRVLVRVQDREQVVRPGSTALTESVARYLYKLMAYKDEYEVARLYTDGDFLKKLGETFEGDYQLRFHMAPPIFNRGLDAQGRPRKRRFGPWMLAALKVLVRFKGIRGTALDPFNWFSGTTRRAGDDWRLPRAYRGVVDGLERR